MPAGEMEQFARIAAIVAGILFGGWALSSVIWVWTKKQIYAYGGSALSVVGVILMGLSIYKTVDVKAAPDGIGIKLAEMERLLKEQSQVKLAQGSDDVDTRISELKAIAEQGKTQAAAQTRIIADLENRVAALNKSIERGSIVQRASSTSDPKTNDNWLFGTSNAVLGSVTKQPDGMIFYNYFPDISDPKYSARIQDQIKIATEKHGTMHPELSNLYIKLGESYQKQGRNKEARAALEQGLKLLPGEDSKDHSVKDAK